MTNSLSSSQLTRLKEVLTMKNETNKTVLIVDGNNTFIRSYAINPKVDANVNHVGGISGCLYSIGYAIKQFNLKECIIVFDGKGGSIVRRKIYKDYKKGRKVNKSYNRIDFQKDDSGEYKINEMALLMEILDSLPVKVIILDKVEADDVIAFIAKKMYDNADKVIMSTDADFLQLVDEDIKVWSPTKKKLYDKNLVKEEFGVMPENYLYYKIIIGDSSDNINGIRGIGKKRLQKYLASIYSTEINGIDEYLDRAEEVNNKYGELLIENKEILIRNYKLMNLLDGGFINSTQYGYIKNQLDKAITHNKYNFIQLITQHQIFNKTNPLKWYFEVFMDIL